MQVARFLALTVTAERMSPSADLEHFKRSWLGGSKMAGRVGAIAMYCLCWLTVGKERTEYCPQKTRWLAGQTVRGGRMNEAGACMHRRR